MNVYMMDDNFYHDLSSSAINMNKDIDLLVSNSVFDKCTTDYKGAAIYIFCKTAHISRICCYRCHATTGGSFMDSSSTNYVNDLSIALSSPETPTSDDTMCLIKDSYVKRLNCSNNKAKGSCSFQCFLSSKFSVSYAICTGGSDGHLTEITDTQDGTVKNLILVDNSYSNTGLYFEKFSNQANVQFSDCVFARNKGNETFVKAPFQKVSLVFQNCHYFGKADFGYDGSGILKATCPIPKMIVGVSTYECKNVFPMDHLSGCKNGIFKI